MSGSRMHLLYFASASFGGLADYAREQARALAQHGVALEVLCPPSFRPAADSAGVRVSPQLREAQPDASARSRLARLRRFLALEVGNHRQLARVIREHGHRHVLLASYAEYFAPLWSGPLRRLAREGVMFGAVVHDPVRDAVLGPAWWHRRSVAEAYSFLRHAFVHESITLDTVRPAPDLITTVIPHGPYEFATTLPARGHARQQLDLPLDKTILLAFGHIRDSKNLHLIIEALQHFPELYLVVAGTELSASQRPVEHYRQLARQFGVDARCRWHDRFIRADEVGAFFAAADFLCLTYARSFRSASGVLSAATQFRKPALASSGAGPLRSAVNNYRLGVWVEPDDAAAVVAGLRELLTAPPQPRWDDYVRDHSWERNAAIVADAFFGGAN